MSQSERGFATIDSRRLFPAIECNDQTLLVFGLVYVARLYFAMLVLWSRPPDWHEIPIVYVFFIPSIFYTMVRGKIDECSAPVTAVAIFLYVVGSGFSTIGEYQRYAFKKQPANKGKLMTGGLWSLTMHANYFGDTLLFTGWTLASSGLAVSWTWWAVPVMTALFVFMHIPVRAPRPGSPSDEVAAMAYKWDSSVTASPRAGPRRVPRGPLPEGIPQVRLVDGEIHSVYLLSSRAELGKNPTP